MRPTPRHLAKMLAQEAFAGLWGAGFGFLGQWRTPRAEKLRFGDEGPVLVVAPHPDDEVIGCGGAILEHRAAGDPVDVAYVTDGRRSRAFGLTPDRMAETRKGEAKTAAARLRVDRLQWFGLREGEWRPDELQARLCEELQRGKPEIVYAPSRVDFHPQHHAVAHALAAALEACYPVGEGPRIRVVQLQVPLGALLVNRFADISEVAPAHLAALDAYASQRGSIIECLRTKRYAARAHRLTGLAEEFWQMTADEYRRLHGESPDRWQGRFRGFRYLAVSDPAAYLVGRRERRRLASASRSRRRRVR